MASTLGLLAFLVGFGAHLVRWRLAPPADSGRVLVLTMVVGVVATVVIAATLARFVPGLARLAPAGVIGLLHALLVGLALAAAYVMTYPAIEVESPTLEIVKAVARHEPQGLPAAALYRVLDDNMLVVPRMQELLDEKLAVLEGGRYRLTARGRSLARLFSAWRHLLGAAMGG